MAKKEQELRDKAKEAEKRGDMTTHDDLIAKADRQQHDMVLFDSITGAIYGPNTNGVTGYVARAVAPQVSYQIGQYFKGNDFLNELDSGNRSSEGSAPHILAHGILAAAVSSATGNDPTTGALSAMGAEAAAPMVANFLFGDKPISELTADEKATVSSITSLAGLGLGATTGDVGSAVNSAETGKVAVEDNHVIAISAGGDSTPIKGKAASSSLYLSSDKNGLSVGTSGTIADTIGFGGSIGAGIDYFKDMDNYKGRADTAEVCAIAACARIHINPQTKETIGWGISPLTEVGGGFTFYKGDTTLYHNPISIKKDKGKK